VNNNSMFRNVLLDTGPLVAILCEKDEHHHLCLDTLRGVVPPMLTTWPVLTEAAWLLRDEPESVESLFNHNGLFTVVGQTDEDFPTIRSVLRKYRSLTPQLADVSLLNVAETHDSRVAFTLDRRDSTVYRVKGKALRLLPEVL